MYISNVMYCRQLLPKLAPQSALYLIRPYPSRTPLLKRFKSSTPPESTPRIRVQVSKILHHLPRSLQKYTNGLRAAPVAHVVSFLALHEITAIVPLVGLSYCFHVTNWLPDFSEETIGVYTEKFRSYFGRKGWFGFSNDSFTSDTTRSKSWTPDAGAKLLLEVATAYAITKAIIIPRVMLSIWATPWFARVVFSRVATVFARLGNRQKITKDLPKKTRDNSK